MFNSERRMIFRFVALKR